MNLLQYVGSQFFYIQSMKVNRQIVQEMNLEELFDIIRKLLVVNNTFIRCAGNHHSNHSF